MLVAVVPAYNEAQHIGAVVRDLLAQGVERCVVVDDGSSDATAQAAREAGAIVVAHAVNRGQGAALETGNEYARAMGAQVVVHYDADGQFNPGDVSGALQYLGSCGADVVLGSRFLDSRSRLPWSKRHVVLPLSRVLNRWLTGVKLTDVHNGFRILTRRALDTITITQDGMAHNTEIIREIRRHGLRFAEYPVEVRYREYGQGIGGGFKILWDLLVQAVAPGKK